jgi:hypothetical protein
MPSRLPFDILPQPDEASCGPTCLHAIYRYFGDRITLDELIAETRQLKSGGTLAVFLACHALQRGYRATLYTYNLQTFDPTWFEKPATGLAAKLREQLRYKADPKLHEATPGYLEFIERGGRLQLEDLTAKLLRRHLKRGIPFLTGLSATYLYRTAREFGPQDDYDDIRGEPSGHFVVLHGYERENRRVRIADPMPHHAVSEERTYTVGIERVICAVMLGVLTYDANLLVIEPAAKPQGGTPWRP